MKTTCLSLGVVGFALAASLVLAVGLAAGAAGENGPDATSRPAAESAPTSQPARGGDTFYLREGDVVLFLGDSITNEGTFFRDYVYGEDIRKAYPELVTDGGKLVAADANTKLKFVNGGGSGDTAANGLARLPALLAKHKPTVCVVCFGMNDRYKDRKGYAANMAEIVKKLKAANVAVTLLTSPNIDPLSHPEHQEYVKVLGEMADEVKTLAKEQDVLFVDCYTPGLKFQTDAKKKIAWADGIHPNHEGHRIMATALSHAWGYGRPLAGAKGKANMMTFWNGDEVSGGNGWTQPRTDANAIRVSADDPHGGKNCLTWTAAGSGWMGGGWNLYNWYPATAGGDVSNFRNLVLWVKVTGEKLPADLKIKLNSSYPAKGSEDASIVKYCSQALDGKWHEVVIPLKDIVTEKSGINPQNVWGFDISTTAQEAKFVVAVDDVTFDNRPAPTSAPSP